VTGCSREAAVQLSPDDPLKVLARMGIHGAPLERWVSVLKRDPCVYCGARSEMTIDHIEARSRGHAKAGVVNGAPACFNCNQAKQDDSLLELLTRSIPIPPKPAAPCTVVVTRTAKRHAHRTLGAVPPDEWWETVAVRIVARALRATWVKLTDGKERAWWVVPVVSRDGVDLDMLVLARTIRQRKAQPRVEFMRVGAISLAAGSAVVSAGGQGGA
jgi:hypothetical protein